MESSHQWASKALGAVVLAAGYLAGFGMAADGADIEGSPWLDGQGKYSLSVFEEPLQVSTAYAALISERQSNRQSEVCLLTCWHTCEVTCTASCAVTNCPKSIVPTPPVPPKPKPQL